jgi:hypothetical protein
MIMAGVSTHRPEKVEGGESIEQSALPITADELFRIAGTIPDRTVASIIASGATVPEVLEAYAWLTAGTAPGSDVEHARRGRVGQVYDLFQAGLSGPSAVSSSSRS